jgi:hypothetical protein
MLSSPSIVDVDECGHTLTQGEVMGNLQITVQNGDLKGERETDRPGLQEFVKACLPRFFLRGHQPLRHPRQVTIQSKDIQLARRLRGER